MLLTAVLLPAPEGDYSALNTETSSTSQGDTVEEALANLREATELFVEEFPLSISDTKQAVVLFPTTMS